MTPPKRPTLYALQSGQRRPRRAPRPLLVLAVVVPAAVMLVAGYAVWVVWPLTDRGAGVVSTPRQPAAVPQDGGPGSGQAVSLPPLSADDASIRPIRGVGATAAMVLDSGDGRVLWMRRPHEERAVASLTKLMTALLIPPGGPRSFRITPAMVGVPGSGLGLTPGQRVRTRDMLAAMLVGSANDASTALAVHRSGSVAAFVRLMNREARRLRLGDTRYSNPSGIFDEGNYSSAWDVADLTRRVLAEEYLARLVASKVFEPARGANYVNTNELLWTYDGATGVKTGFTDASGRSLVASSTRDGRTLIAVVLDAPRAEFAEAARLLNWGFKRQR